MRKSLPLISNVKLDRQGQPLASRGPGTGPTPNTHPALFPDYHDILSCVAINSALFLHWIAAGHNLHRDIAPFSRQPCKHCGRFTPRHLLDYLSALDADKLEQWILTLLEDAVAGKPCKKPALYCEARECRDASTAARLQPLDAYRDVQNLRSPEG